MRLPLTRESMPCEEAVERTLYSTAVHVKWKIPAQTLLDTGDVGLVPWIPLCDAGDSPEPVLERCRELIDQQAPPGEHENLLVVTAVLAGLRYTKAELFPILGDPKMIVESPLLKELLDEVRPEIREEGRQEGRQEGRRDSILRLLEKRFGRIPDSLVERVRAVHDDARLQQIFDLATDCQDLASFESAWR